MWSVVNGQHAWIASSGGSPIMTSGVQSLPMKNFEENYISGIK